MAKRVTRLAAAMVLVLCVASCEDLVPMPDGAVGTWVTDDPRYARCFFRITPDTFVVGTPRGAEPHTIRHVRKTVDENVELYVVTYVAEGGEQDFAFHLDGSGRKLTRKSQPGLTWRKEAAR